MNKDEVYEIIDEIRERNFKDNMIRDRIMNYIEANMDEFVEYFEEE